MHYLVSDQHQVYQMQRSTRIVPHWRLEWNPRKGIHFLGIGGARCYRARCSQLGKTQPAGREARFNWSIPRSRVGASGPSRHHYSRDWTKDPDYGVSLFSAQSARLGLNETSNEDRFCKVHSRRRSWRWRCRQSDGGSRVQCQYWSAKLDAWSLKHYWPLTRSLRKYTTGHWRWESESQRGPCLYPGLGRATALKPNKRKITFSSKNWWGSLPSWAKAPASDKARRRTQG